MLLSLLHLFTLLKSGDSLSLSAYVLETLLELNEMPFLPLLLSLDLEIFHQLI